MPSSPVSIVHSPRSVCHDYLFQHEVSCSPGPGYIYRYPSPSTTDNRAFPKVLIIGGGISGLTCAVELIRIFKQMYGINDHDAARAPIYIVEASNNWGGKMIGEKAKSSNFLNNPVEHSTRAFSSAYISMFDLLRIITPPSIISTDKDFLSVYFKNMALENTDGETVHDKRFTSIQYVNNASASAIDQSGSLIDKMKHYNVPKKDTRFVYKQFMDWWKGDEETKQNLTYGKTFGDYMKWNTLEQATRNFIQSVVGIIVAARIECDAYAILHILEVFFLPQITATYNDTSKYPNLGRFNCARGPTSRVIIDPILKYIKMGTTGSYSDDTNIKLNTRVLNLNIDLERNKHSIKSDQSGINIPLTFDIVIICTPHLVAHKLLEQQNKSNYMNKDIDTNSWTFGIQVYFTYADWANLEKIQPQPSENKYKRVYQSILNGPWEIVYVLLYSKEASIGTPNKPAKMTETEYNNTLWGPGQAPIGATTPLNNYSENFGTKAGEKILACLTLTMSNQYNLGNRIPKTFLNCTPTELVTEALNQIGISDSQNLIHHVSFGSILYKNINEITPTELVRQRPEWLVGPIQPNGFYWASNYTLYIKKPSNSIYGCKGICSYNSYRDNKGCFDMQLLPDTQGTINTIGDWHNRGLSNAVNGGNIPASDIILPAVPKLLPQGIYLAGEYCDTYYNGYAGMQVPTMGRACESAKIACQKIMEDYGLKINDNVKNVQGLEFGDLKSYPSSSSFIQKGIALLEIAPWIYSPSEYISILLMIILIITVITFATLIGTKKIRSYYKNQYSTNYQQYSNK